MYKYNLSFHLFKIFIWTKHSIVPHPFLLFNILLRNSVLIELLSRRGVGGQVKFCSKFD